MRKLPISLLCGVAAILLTIILYFTILGNIFLQAIHFVSLVAVVVAELITTVYSVKAKDRPRRVAAAIVSSFMIPATICLSFIYIINFPNNYSAYIGWYFAGTVVVNGLALVLLVFDSAKNTENVNFQAAKSNILYMRKLVKAIMVEPAASAYSLKLNSIEEKLHFTNDSMTVPEDTEILQMLNKLQQNIANPDFDVEELLVKLEQKIETRTILTSRNV